MADVFDEVFDSTSPIGTISNNEFDVFDEVYSSKPSLLSSFGKGIVEAPGAAITAIKSIPSGLENLLTSIFSPKQSIESGNTEKVVRGVGTLGAGAAGAGTGAMFGSALGPVGTLAGGAIGGAAGLLGFDYLNQAVGNDKVTTGEEDLNKLAELTGQGVTMGAIGATIKGASNLVSQGGPKLAEILNRKSIGARQGDFAKSAKSGLAENIEGETTTKLANDIEQVRKEGGFDGTRNPVKLLDRNTEILDTIENDLSNVLQTADSVNTKAPFIPKYTIAEKWIKTQPASEQAALIDALDEIKVAHNNLLDGTLDALQKEKRALYGKTYGESGAAKEALSKYVASDLKTAIEKGVDDLAAEGIVPAELAGTVKSLNERSGIYQNVRPILTREVVKSMTDDPMAKLANIGFTTGGIGAPAIAGSIIAPGIGTAIGAGIGLTGKALTTPTGQALTASALRGASAAASPVSKLLNRVLRPEVIGAAEASGKITKKESKTLSLAAEVLSKPELANLDTEEDMKQKPSLNVPKSLVSAVIKQESGGNPKAVSPKGATGLMQIMPKTAKEIAGELGIEDYDLTDPETSKLFGTHYLAKMLKQFGDTRLALAAYNSGPGRVQRLLNKYGNSYSAIRSHLPSETKQYVMNIVNNLPKNYSYQV